MLQKDSLKSEGVDGLELKSVHLRHGLPVLVYCALFQKRLGEGKFVADCILYSKQKFLCFGVVTEKLAISPKV